MRAAESDPVRLALAVWALDPADSDRERQRRAAGLARRLAAGDIQLPAARLTHDCLRFRQDLELVTAAAAFPRLRIGDVHPCVLTAQAEHRQQVIGLRGY